MNHRALLKLGSTANPRAYPKPADSSFCAVTPGQLIATTPSKLGKSAMSPNDFPCATSTFGDDGPALAANFDSNCANPSGGGDWESQTHVAFDANNCSQVNAGGRFIT